MIRLPPLPYYFFSCKESFYISHSLDLHLTTVRYEIFKNITFVTVKHLHSDVARIWIAQAFILLSSSTEKLWFN